MSKIMNAFWIAALIVPSLALGEFKEEFPIIKATTGRYSGVDPKNVQIEKNIKDVSGKKIYKFQCHSRGYVGDPEFDYSGDVECRLSLLNGENTFSNLLTEDAHQTRDWESRGRFFFAELRSPCSDIPNFGSVREFKLRGMKITIAIKSSNFGEDPPKSLSLVFSAKPDSSAKREIAEVVPRPTSGIPSECKIPNYSGAH